MCVCLSCPLFLRFLKSNLGTGLEGVVYLIGVIVLILAYPLNTDSILRMSSSDLLHAAMIDVGSGITFCGI